LIVNKIKDVNLKSQVHDQRFPFSHLEIVLASTSPRRKALLEQVGVQFSTTIINVDESVFTGETPENYVIRLARDKVIAAISDFPDHTVIVAADTTVTVDGHILGKPADREEAFVMWNLLSGRIHQVMTGVAVAFSGQVQTIIVQTDVEFVSLTHEQMQDYWNSGEPIGKAGAYAIQGLGAVFIPRIHGSYSNVVGLPLVETVALMTAITQ
jgi:septum formation protein